MIIISAMTINNRQTVYLRKGDLAVITEQENTKGLPIKAILKGIVKLIKLKYINKWSTK